MKKTATPARPVLLTVNTLAALLDMSAFNLRYHIRASGCTPILDSAGHMLFGPEEIAHLRKHLRRHSPKYRQLEAAA